MHTTQVEVCSDASTFPVLHHAGRNHPGIPVQGSSLWRLCRQMDQGIAVLEQNGPDDEDPPAAQLNGQLQAGVVHSRRVSTSRGMDLPFPES